MLLCSPFYFLTQVAQRVLMAQLAEVEPHLPTPGTACTAPGSSTAVASTALARAVSLSHRSSGHNPGSPAAYTPPRSPVLSQQQRRSPVSSSTAAVQLQGAVPQAVQQQGAATPTRSTGDRTSAPSPFMAQQQQSPSPYKQQQPQQILPHHQHQQQGPAPSKSMLLRQALLAGASPVPNSWIDRRGAWRATLERHGLSLHPGHSSLSKQAPGSSIVTQGLQRQSQQQAGGAAIADLPPLPKPPSEPHLASPPAKGGTGSTGSQAAVQSGSTRGQGSILDRVQAAPKPGMLAANSTGADWIRRRSAWREQLVRHQAQLLAGETALAFVHNLGAAAAGAASGQRSRPQLSARSQGLLRHSVTAQ